MMTTANRCQCRHGCKSKPVSEPTYHWQFCWFCGWKNVANDPDHGPRKEKR